MKNLRHILMGRDHQIWVFTVKLYKAKGKIKRM